MYNQGDEPGEIRAKLREVEESFDREMRKRGFDPSQAENIALPGPLAKLYAEREQLRADVAGIEQENESNRE